MKSKHIPYILYLLPLLFSTLSGTAQLRLPENGMRAGGDIGGGSHWNNEDDTVRTVKIPTGIYAWNIDERFGSIHPVIPDTVPHRFQNDNNTDGPTGHYAFLGNLGSARVSRLRSEQYFQGFSPRFIFASPYDFFIKQPGELLFTNTKSPFTNITYHECGNKQNGEDRIRALFSTNVNKRLGLGFKLDYLYGRGYYDSQSTAHFNGTLFGSYLGERYQMHTLYYANHLKATENGGIESDDYVMRPEMFPAKYGTSDMPTRLSRTWNKMNVNTLFFTQRYNLGFNRIKDEKGNIVKADEMKARAKWLKSAIQTPDSIKGLQAVRTDSLKVDITDSTRNFTSEFVPVAGFVHTLRIDHNNRRFLSNLRENATSSTYFKDFYLPGDSANDFTKNLHLENQVTFEIHEGFNNWVKSGLRLFARHEYSRYTLPDEQKTPVDYKENEFAIGAQLVKEQGTYFHYNLLGELRTSGKDWGEFNVTGGADFNLPLKKDTMTLRVEGQIKNERPSFYYRHYHGRNAWWDNDLNKELTFRVGGELSYKRTRLSAGFESTQNYTYFAETQEPYTGSDGIVLAHYGVGVGQSGKNIQVIHAGLGQDFVWGIFHWENDFRLQFGSDDKVMPLPLFTGYSNVYILFHIAKVLRTELGADVRFFSKYYAPTYSPIIGQWTVQDETQRYKLGNYPIVNAYINFHLKRTRFYVMASHVNYSSGKGDPFAAPHYALNRMVLRLGLSWNFDN